MYRVRWLWILPLLSSFWFSGGTALTLYRVRLTFRPPHPATQVTLAGTFNQWNPSAHPMKREGEVFVTELLLPAGVYQYKFVVNGNTWYPDPKNPEKTPDGFGGWNSVLQVGPDRFPAVVIERGDGTIHRSWIRHDPGSIQDANLLGDRLLLQLHFLPDDLDSVRLQVYRRAQTLTLPATLQNVGPLEEVARVAVPLQDSTPFTYQFQLFDGPYTILYPQRPVAWDPKRAQRFEVPAWVQGAVIYQIFPDRFFNGDPTNDPPQTRPWQYEPLVPPEGWYAFYGGDLQGITAKLDFLQDLGIEAIYLNPIFVSPSNHGYNITDYFHVNPRLGGDPAFDTLLQAAHARGIKIILDGVFNHSSDQHPFFQDVRARGPESPYYSWYRIKRWPFPDRFDTEKPSDYYDCWWGFGSLPEWNMENPEVREYLLRVAEYWTRKGIDGWRLDVPNEVPHDFWKTFRKRVRAINPEIYIVGEIWGEGTPWLQGDEFDAVMNYPLRSLILDLLQNKKSPTSFQNEVAQLYQKYPPQTQNALFNLLGSHDTPRALQILQGDTAKFRAAVFLQMTLPGAPVIYYGDEIGMLGDKDPDCRRVYIWEPEHRDEALRAYYRSLIHLRSAHPALRKGDLKFLGTSQAVAFLRTFGDETLLCVLNPTAAPMTLQLPVSGGPVLWGTPKILKATPLHLRLGPYAGAILTVRRPGSLKTPAE